VSERRALVTGASGFVGGHLVPAFGAADWKVHAIVRASSSAERVGALKSAGCTIHVHDGSSASMRAIVKAAAPLCTWHLATKFVPSHASDDVAPLVRSNVEFGTMLLDALADAGNGAIVTVGTAWQQHDNVDPAPMSLYAATKEAFDAISVYYASVRRMQVVECLLFDCYGPNDPRKKILWALRNALKTGVPLELSGDGTQFMDYLHVDDIVRALIVAGARATAAAPGTRERWAVRSTEPVTVRQLVDRLGKAKGGAIPVKWNARPPRATEMNVAWTAGDVLPGWSPRVSLDDGLAALD
jgi:nucleoside-diphosphate-sugar epimerase